MSKKTGSQARKIELPRLSSRGRSWQAYSVGSLQLAVSSRQSPVGSLQSAVRAQRRSRQMHGICSGTSVSSSSEALIPLAAKPKSGRAGGEHDRLELLHINFYPNFRFRLSLDQTQDEVAFCDLKLKTKEMPGKRSIVKPLEIENRIFTIRGFQVMLDSHLAELYMVETGRLNEQVKRNTERFPKEFMFQLTEDEYDSLRSQIAILKISKRKHRK